MLKQIILLGVLVTMFCLNLTAQEAQVRELYAKGAEESRKGNFDAAIQFYTEAIKLDNGFSSAYTGRGLAYMRKPGINPTQQKQNWEKSLSDLSTAIALNPKSPGAYINRSTIYSLLKDYDKALADLQKGGEIDPTFPHIYAARGSVYNKMKEFQNAIDNYTKAIEIKRQSDFYRGRCNAYYDLGKFEEAVADCSEAINLNPKFGWAFYYRGLSRQKLQQNALAISDFRKTLEFEPNHRGAKQELEKLLKENKY